MLYHVIQCSKVLTVHGDIVHCAVRLVALDVSLTKPTVSSGVDDRANPDTVRVINETSRNTIPCLSILAVSSEALIRNVLQYIV